MDAKLRGLSSGARSVVWCFARTMLFPTWSRMRKTDTPSPLFRRTVLMVQWHQRPPFRSAKFTENHRSIIVCLAIFPYAATAPQSESTPATSAIVLNKDLVAQRKERVFTKANELHRDFLPQVEAALVSVDKVSSNLVTSGWPSPRWDSSCWSEGGRRCEWMCCKETSTSREHWTRAHEGPRSAARWSEGSRGQCEVRHQFHGSLQDKEGRMWWGHGHTSSAGGRANCCTEQLRRPTAA